VPEPEAPGPEGPVSRGRFITFEGGEGSGKSTQARLLAATLDLDGFPVVITREPGGSPGAEALRGLLLGGEHPFAPLAEAMLHSAARADHVATLIRPRLSEGRHVVCDRYTDSTLAYQGHVLGAGTAAVEALTALIALPPDLTFVLDLSAEQAMQRLVRRGGGLDRYEALGLPFFAAVAEAFRAIVAAYPERCVLVRADRPVKTLQLEIRALLRERLGLG
jgi:dTMP kinase